MKWRSTLLLALLLAGLVAGYFLLQQREAAEEAQVLDAKRVFDFAAGDIQKLEIDPLAEPGAAAERDGAGGWRMIAPDPGIEPLDMLWDRVAEHFAALQNERTLVGADDPAAYGLDEPALTVRADTSGRAGITVEFGELDPTQSYRYARLDQGPVFLVHTDQFFELNRNLDLLRDAFVITDRESPVLALEFARLWREDEPDSPATPTLGEESVVVKVARDTGDAPWRLESPLQAPADQEAVDALVKEIQFARGRQFIDRPENLDLFGLGIPVARVSLWTAGAASPETVFFGNLEPSGEQGGIYAQKEGRQAVFLIDANVATLFPRTPDAWRDPRLLTQPAERLTAINVDSAGNHVRLESHPEDGWQVVEPMVEETDQFAVSNFISYLKLVEGQEFFEGSLEDYGLDAPEGRLRLEWEDGEVREIRLAPSDAPGDTYYATRDAGNVVRITRKQAQDMMARAERFVPRILLRVPSKEISKLDVTLRDLHVILERVHGKWVVREPEGRTLGNQSDGDALAQALSDVRATDVAALALQPDGSYGFNAPVLNAEVTVRHGESVIAHGPLTIGEVTAEDPLLRYATMAGRKELFLINQDLLDAVEAALGELRNSK